MQTSSTTAITLPQTGTWVLDPAHTTVGFAVRHLMAAKVRGRFGSVEGRITMGDAPGTSSVVVAIDAASIDTGAEDRDNHLRSDDFLTVEEHPTLDFASTEVVDRGDGLYAVTGDLTIKGTSRPVTLEVRYAGLMNDPWGTTKAIFSAEATIDRDDWGLTWNAPLETGGWLVGKEIKIEIEAQASRAD